MGDVLEVVLEVLGVVLEVLDAPNPSLEGFGTSYFSRNSDILPQLYDRPTDLKIDP